VISNEFDKSREFSRLVAEVQGCTECERMTVSARVLNYSAGNLRADLLFVGEAPGRLGADATEIPFHGDTAGKNFEDLLKFAGISRNDVYVTNAVLCNPKDEQGNNSTPNTIEISNCTQFLRRQIELVNPKIVVALGNAALRSLALIEPHPLTLSMTPIIRPWFGRFLIPLYHPGQRAMVHRSFANQRSDYQFVGEQWRRLDKLRRVSSGATKSDILAVAHQLLSEKPRSYFELHKLAYLAEYLHVRRSGRRLTKAYFIRQKDGPYCTDLELRRLQRADDAVRVTKRSGKLYLHRDPSAPSGLFAESTSEDANAAVREALERYGEKTDAELKTAVYLTAPMRFLLRKEQSTRSNLYNAPIDFLAAG